jgi:hypothetical protein
MLRSVRLDGAVGRTAVLGSIRLDGAAGRTAMLGSIRLDGAAGRTAVLGSIRLDGAVGRTAVLGSIRFMMFFLAPQISDLKFEISNPGVITMLKSKIQNLKSKIQVPETQDPKSENRNS